MNEEFPILIAEDSPDDTVLLERALRRAGFNNPFHISENGLDVIAYLKGEPPYEDRDQYKFPRLLITDLKMPIMDGFEILAWLQAHEECSVIPKIVMSASYREEDVLRAYRLGANSYLAKPLNFAELVGSLRLVFDYWEMVQKPKLPPKC